VVKLSILMPVYNEAARLAEAVRRTLAVPYPCEVELVVVDDGSTDGSAGTLSDVDDDRLRLVRHAANRGKGEAIRTAAERASGDYLVILDADLEYDPGDIPRLLAPVFEQRATVVFGSRMFNCHNAFTFWYVMGNRTVTSVANLLFNCYLGDLATCYKLMPVELFRSMRLASKGFGMDAEVTGRLLRNGYRPYEVPISYRARSRDEGKKVTWRDGIAHVAILLRERFRRPGAVINS
jgi:glycosyltransferase involved in cell wall biosynthesis